MSTTGQDRVAHLYFQGPSVALRTPRDVWCFTNHWTLSPN